MYVKEIWDKIFSEYGYTYESTFIDSARFKKFIIPFSRERLELSNTQIENRLFRAANRNKQEIELVSVGAINISNAETIQFDDDSSGNNFDNGANYDIATFDYTVPDTGYYTFVVPVYYGLRLVPDTTATVTPTLTTTLNITYDILKNGATVIGSKTTNISTTNISAFTTSYESANTIAQPDPNGIFNSIEDPDYSNRIYVSANNALLTAGDIITVRFYCPQSLLTEWSVGGGNGTDRFVDGSSNYYDGKYYIQVKTGSFWYNKINNIGVVEGGTVDMNTVLPVDIEIKNFVSSIVKMFNLYIEQDPDNEKNYFIEPRNDFYNNGVVKDIEDKLDYDSQQEIEPMGALDAGRYFWTYKEDKDYYNQRYIETWGGGR